MARIDLLVNSATLFGEQAGRTKQLVYLSVDCFVRGRLAGEPTWDSHARAMCEEHGWDLEQVRGQR